MSNPGTICIPSGSFSSRCLSPGLFRLQAGAANRDPKRFHKSSDSPVFFNVFRKTMSKRKRFQHFGHTWKMYKSHRPKKKCIPLRTSVNKKRHREFGRVRFRLALQASFRYPAGMEVVKYIKTQYVFNLFGMKVKKTQCFSIVLKVPFWPCLARGGHLPRPAGSHLFALSALMFLRPISEATKMSSRPYKSGPLNFQGERSAL